MTSTLESRPRQSSPFTALYNDAGISIMQFLRQQEQRIADCVSRAFRPWVWGACQRECSRKGMRVISAGIDPKEWLFKFPDAIGPDFYREYLGEVDAIPIPRVFAERARLGFKLIFIPEHITIEVDESSPLMLDESTAIDGKQARLREDPAKKDLPLTGLSRKIKVPVTLNNIILLTHKYLKKYKWATKFGGMDVYSGRTVLDQNGDSGVGPSHWSYQKENLIGLGAPYLRRVELAGAADLGIVPLVDRLVFHLAQHAHSGRRPQYPNVEQTSTLTLDESGLPWPSVIWLPSNGSYFHLRLHDGRSEAYFSVGTAAGVFPAIQAPHN